MRAFCAGHVTPKTWFWGLISESMDGAEPVLLLHGDGGLGLGAAAVEAGGLGLLVQDVVGPTVQPVLVGSRVSTML